MHSSCLLLCCSFLVVFSNINATPVQKRGLIPTNINLDLKLGKGSAARTAEEPPPAPGSRKTVINAPFGLASLTITTNRKNSTNTNEAGKPCNPESELIESNGDIKNLYHGGSSNSDTLGGKGGAFFGPSYPPHPGFGPPPSPHDYHHSYPHYPPPPPSHNFHHHPPPPHQHHPDCHHGEFFHPSDSSTTIPEIKPDGKFTTVNPPTLKDKVPVVTMPTSTTDHVDLLIEDIFNGPNSYSSTTTRTNIDVNDREQTGEDNLDIRMPKN